MSLVNTTEDGDKTLFLQPEASETSSLLNQFTANTNILVVDNDFITLLDMKKIMKQYAYQVTVYADAEEAIAFLTTCKHEINIVIWDFHMPVINGLQALKIIGSEMDLPVVIMSDDNQTESVMNATIHGACDYIMKPVREEVIANIWQHIVRKRMMSKPGLIQPVQLEMVQNEGLEQGKDDSMTINLRNSEQNMDMLGEKAAKKPRMTRMGEIQPIQSDSVQSNGSDQDNDGSMTVSQHKDGEQSFKKENEKMSRKPRMSWTGDLQQKFLKAIEIVGGPTKANPKALLKCLQDMKIEGLTRGNVASHLQKHRLSLVENQIPQQTRETDWSSLSPLLGLNNDLTATSSLMNGRAVYPVQENQYQSGYLALLNNNQFMTNNTMPCFPYFDHDSHLLQQLKQQQYQLPHQLNYMMRTNEPEQASGVDVTDLDPFYPSSPYDDPNEFLTNGYDFSQ